MLLSRIYPLIFTVLKIKIENYKYLFGAIDIISSLNAIITFFVKITFVKHKNWLKSGNFFHVFNIWLS
jgi:hypothetical protein